MIQIRWILKRVCIALKKKISCIGGKARFTQKVWMKDGPCSWWDMLVDLLYGENLQVRNVDTCWNENIWYHHLMHLDQTFLLLCKLIQLDAIWPFRSYSKIEGHIWIMNDLFIKNSIK